MRFIVRPNHIARTPRALCRALGARRTIPVANVVHCDYLQDLFLAYPPVDKVANAPAGYNHVQTFYGANKFYQRAMLVEAGLPVVPTDALDNGFADFEIFVVRPLRHSQGQGFRRTDDYEDYDPSAEYISAFIDKEKEYRALYYKGKHVCTYLKQVPEGLSADQPWTHANGCRFVTINNPDNDRVTRLGLNDKLLATALVQTASLVAFDILYANRQLYVCEANLSPGLSIPGTIAKIVSIESVGAPQ